MNIDKYRIAIDEPNYVWIPGQCPVCKFRVPDGSYMNTIIGWGEDSDMHFKERVNNGVHPVIFTECPQCFEKSYLHIHGSDYNSRDTLFNTAMKLIENIFITIESLVEAGEIENRWE